MILFYIFQREDFVNVHLNYYTYKKEEFTPMKIYSIMKSIKKTIMREKKDTFCGVYEMIEIF